MKILVHGINYAPDLIGIAKYTTEMCEFFEGLGHQVRVVTAPPYYPAWRITRQYRGYLFASESIGHVHVSRCPLYVPKSPNALARVLHHLSFAAMSAPVVIMAALRFRPDVVIAVAPSLLGVPGAVAAARLSGAASWLHVQDFEVDAAFDLGFVSGSFLKRVALAIERILIRRFDRISTISANMVRSIERKGASAFRVVEFRNWVDTAAIVPIPRPTALRRSFKVPDDAVLAMYSGNMGTKQGLEYMAAAAQRLSVARPDIIFVFCGSGPMKGTLQAMTRSLANVLHLDLQPGNVLSELLSTADIHLLPQRPETLDLAMPSKLAGMLASGRPVIAMAEHGTQLAAELDGVGVVLPPGDVDALCAAIIALADDPDLRDQLGAKGRQLACSRWDRGVVLAQIDKSLYTLTTAPARERRREEKLVNREVS